MPRKPSENLTAREAQVMDVLWRVGEASADQIRAELPEPLHDSTVRTLLRVLEAKGQVKHVSQGKAYRYRAVVGRRPTQRRALRTLLSQFFGGSAEELVQRLIEDEQLTPEQWEALRPPAPDQGQRSDSEAPKQKRRRKGES